MHRGSGSFADYHVWVDDFDARLAANRRLDELREQLWKEFGL